MIVVTHEMGFARAVAGLVAFIAAGKVAEHGPSGELFAAPKEEMTRRFLSKVMRFA